jgi:hypothetical protein
LFALFGTGKIIFGQTIIGLLFFALAFVAAFIIYYNLKKAGWKKIAH